MGYAEDPGRGVDGDGDGLDTVAKADRVLARMAEVFKQPLLEFGAAVRSDEKARTHREVCLLKTIAANVNNGKLDDKAFREFVRNSMKVLG